jgi:hypothetical protein
VGLDLKIAIVDGDLSGFDDLKDDQENFWYNNAINDTAVTVDDLGYYQPFILAFLLTHYDYGVVGPFDEVLEKLQQQREEIEKLINYDRIFGPEQIEDIKATFDELLENLTKVEVPFTNKHLFMVTF